MPFRVTPAVLAVLLLFVLVVRTSRALILSPPPWPPSASLIGAALSSSSASFSLLESTTTSRSSHSPSTALWGLRITSALVSYVGLVTFLDRPRGDFFLQPNQYEIKPSQVEGAGLGFYVSQALEKGTILGTYPGVLLPLSPNKSKKLDHHPQCEAYVWRFSDSKFIIDPTNANGDIQPNCFGGNPNVPLSVAICSLLAQPKSTALCRINEPPKGMDINVVTLEDLDKRTVTFVLERNVARGEELFMDYGVSYDRTAYGRATIPNDAHDE